MNNIYKEQLNWFEYYKKHFDFEFKTQPLNIYKYLYEIIESKESRNLTYVNLGDFFYNKYIHFLNENLDLINKNFESLIQNKEIFEYNDFYKTKVEFIIKEYLKFEPQEEKAPEVKNNNKKDKTKELWFIVGVKFATGEMQKMLKENNPTQIAKLLGNKSLRPYITDSIGIDKKSDKNIFSKEKKYIELILNYCKENNLNVCQEFKDKTKHIIAD